jgi:hypothetical protein
MFPSGRPATTYKARDGIGREVHESQGDSRHSRGTQVPGNLTSGLCSGRQPSLGFREGHSRARGQVLVG